MDKLLLLPPVSTAQENKPQQLSQFLMFQLLKNHLAQLDKTQQDKSSLKRFQSLTVLKLLLLTPSRLLMEPNHTMIPNNQTVKLHLTPKKKFIPLSQMEKQELLLDKPYQMVNIKLLMNTLPLAMDLRSLKNQSTLQVVELHT